MSSEFSRTEQKPTELNLSGVRLVMQSDIKEPPVLRGDNSDKCTIREWVEIVETYFVKSNMPTSKQSQKM